MTDGQIHCRIRAVVPRTQQQVGRSALGVRDVRDADLTGKPLDRFSQHVCLGFLYGGMPVVEVVAPATQQVVSETVGELLASPAYELALRLPDNG